ncbi:MAG: hypothetical protein ACM3YE_02690 [Bacteroidota bacterium]
MTPEEFNETIETYNEYLEKMILAVKHFCEDLQETDFKELGMTMPAIAEGLEWIYDAAGCFKDLGKINNTYYSSYEMIVKNLSEALENKDYMLLHDLMEFELLPVLGEMRLTVESN